MTCLPVLVGGINAMISRYVILFVKMTFNAVRRE